MYQVRKMSVFQEGREDEQKNANDFEVNNCTDLVKNMEAVDKVSLSEIIESTTSSSKVDC